LAALLIFSLGFQDCYAERKKRILVLHSYHQGLEWTDNITRGVQSVFEPQSADYEIHYEYLDTKRNTGQAYLDHLIPFIAAKHDRIRYAAVIVCDNNALNLINNGRISFPGNPPKIFCGINNYTPALTERISNITGVVEATDHKATLDLMRSLHPHRKNIVVILDRTPTGEAIREEFRAIEPYYQGQLEFDFVRDFLLEEVPEKLKSLENDSLVYLLTFNRDRHGNFVSYTEGIELLNAVANVPIYGSWDFYLGKGIVGGKIISGFLQGQEAAKLAMKTVDGYPPEKLEVVAESPSEYMFDYRYLDRFGIDTSSLPSGSEILNVPPGPVEKYRSLLIGLTLASLGGALYLLIKYRRQHIKLNREIAQAEKLERMVESRTRDLEIANSKLQRLSIVDGLSQLYNRRYFDQSLDEETRRLQRLSLPISLLMCDIDHFKQYNDRFGHLAGDNCIRSVANTIRKHCRRDTDIVARYGGEEFSVILSGTDSDVAMKIAETIRNDIATSVIAEGGPEHDERVTISIGVASIIPDSATDPTTIVALADKALYASKNNGRNQTTLETQLGTGN
jgi:diguanylate cyclase (GGDEF)-like protein